MSAWLCSENHIGMLAAYLAHRKDTGNQLHNARLFAKTLAEGNLRSLNVRYGDDPVDDIYIDNAMDRAEHYVFNLPSRPPVFWLKQANCLNYQSCEPEDWRETQAYSLCEQIIAHAIRSIPGYDDEPWGVN